MADYDLGTARGRVEIDSTSLKRADAAGKTLATSMASRMKSVGTSMVSAGKKMTLGLTLPIVLGAKVAIDEFAQFQQVNAVTGARIKSTGGAAGVTSKHIQDLASKVGALAVVDDQVVQSGENMLLTFTNIRNSAGKNNDIFDQSTKILADMSASFGTDMSQSAIQLGKALNDPIKGITALTRVGVAFTDQQKAQITRLEEGGHMAKAQQIILKELNKEFGGTAKAMGEAAGPGQRLSVSFRNMAQDAGAILVPFLQTVVGFVMKLFDAFQNLSPSVQKIILVFIGLIAIMGPILVLVGSLLGALATITAAFAAGGAAAGIFGAILTALPFVAIGVAIVLLAILITKNWQRIKAITVAIWHGIYKALSFTPIIVMVKAGLAVLKFAIGHTIGFIADHWKTIWNGMKAVFRTVWGALVGIAKPPLNALISIMNGLINGINLVIRGYNLIPGHTDIGKIPPIPGLSSGAIDWPGGLAWVGERGPELLQLPKGSNVIPMKGRGSLRTAAGAGGLVGMRVEGALDITSRSTAVFRGIVVEEINDESSFRSGLSRRTRAS